MSALLTISLPEAIRTAQVIVRRSAILRVDVCKHLADTCEVHERTVAKWGSGEAPIPEGQADSVTRGLATLGFGTAAVMREMADWLEKCAEGLADDTLTREEYEKCAVEGHEVQVALVLADLALRRKAGI